jgi:citrate lyase subunit beta/citryl-CoA lyase
MNNIDLVTTARSALFVPGDRPDRFAKASASGADLVIIDLEDAVAPERKHQARQHVMAWLSEGGKAMVRVNAIRTEYFAPDCDALVGVGHLLGLVVPMAEDPDALGLLASRVGADVPILAQIETACGLAQAPELAAVVGVARLAIGHLDLAAELGCAPGREPLLFARSSIVLASRLADLPGPIDSVTSALDDPSVCGDDATYAKTLGFTGKFAIHPSQVSAINTAFDPTESEVAWALRLLEAVGDGGAVRLDSEMIDGPVISWARTLLARARRSASSTASEGGR